MTDTARTEPMAPDRLGAQDRPPPRRRLRGSPLRIVVLAMAAGFFVSPVSATCSACARSRSRTDH